MNEQPKSLRLEHIKKAIPETAWPELCIMLLDALQEQQNQINALTSICERLKQQNRVLAVSIGLVERTPDDL